jgi:hypothetical protein
MKRKRIFKYLLFFFLVLLATGAVYIYREYNRTHKDTTRLKPDFRLTASDFLNEFINDEKSANKKYWDKVIVVKGWVKNIKKDENGFYSITMGDTASLSSVRFSLDSAHNGDAILLQEGRIAALKGICAGFNADELLGSDVILVRAVLDKTDKH